MGMSLEQHLQEERDEDVAQRVVRLGRVLNAQAAHKEEDPTNRIARAILVLALEVRDLRDAVDRLER